MELQSAKWLIRIFFASSSFMNGWVVNHLYAPLPNEIETNVCKMDYIMHWKLQNMKLQNLRTDNKIEI